MRWRVQPIKTKGFTLIELMLALSLGSLLFAVMLRLIGADLRLGQAMAQRFRETSWQQRSLELIREELALAHGWMLDPPLMRWPCPMAGRRPVLAIATQADDPQARGEQVIVYAVGPAPDRIWRGQVLMRCGPGYSLDGVPTLQGAFQNRVLLDALPQDSSVGSKCTSTRRFRCWNWRSSRNCRQRPGGAGFCADALRPELRRLGSAHPLNGGGQPCA